jgi:hypothetical protein
VNAARARQPARMLVADATEADDADVQAFHRSP